MEILNNIWNVLSTENEVVTKLITAPLMFVEVYISFGLFTQILGIPYTKKEQSIYVITISVSGIIMSLFLPALEKMIINYIVLYVLVKYLFKLTPLKSIATIVIPLVIFGLVNSLIMNPFLKLFKLTFELASTIPLYRVIYNTLTYIILYLIILFLKKYNYIFVINYNIDKKTSLTIIVNLILGIFTLFIQAILNFYYINTIPIIFTLFNFALLFAYFFTSFYSLTKF